MMELVRGSSAVLEEGVKTPSRIGLGFSVVVEHLLIGMRLLMQ
jgi:hypothetical protein